MENEATGNAVPNKSEMPLDTLMPIREAVEIVFAEAPGFHSAYEQRSYKAIEREEAKKQQTIEELRNHLRDIDTVKDSREDAHFQGEPDQLHRMLEKLEAEETDRLRRNDLVEQRLPTNRVNDVTLRDYVRWCALLRFAVPDSFHESVPEAVRKDTRFNIFPDFERAKREEAWNLLEATSLVFGNIGKFLAPRLDVLKDGGSASIYEPHYPTYIKLMLARNETPHHENDFRLCHCQEFIHARRAIQLKIIEGEHGDDDYTALVVPTSYLAWVLRQGFTIPKPLRSLLETASLADPEGDESGPSCTNEPRSGETPLPKQIFKCSNWKDVRITFRNNHDVAITVRETKILNRPFGFAEFDLKNSKSGKPLRAWEVLREIAEGDGFLPVGKEFKKDRDAIRRQISNLNRTLKSLFGRNDNPITFEKVGADGEGWRAKFAVQQSSTVDSSGKLERF